MAGEPDLHQAAAAPPRGVVIARAAALARMRDQEGMVVLDHERFGGHDISIVSHRM